MSTKRFKGALGALDARIAEEQAKQRAASQQSPSRSSSVSKRPGSRAISPSRRATRPKDQDNGNKEPPSGRGPDPSEFDPDFVIGEDDEPSRAGTPRPKEKAEASDVTQTDNSGKDKEENGKEQARDATLSGQAELPPEVRTKLRKLERLESKYSGMYLYFEPSMNGTF